MENHNMETMVKEIRKDKRRKSSRRSSLANEVFQMLHMNASTKESFDQKEFIKRFAKFRLDFMEEQQIKLSERIKESKEMPGKMKKMLIKNEEMIESNPWKLLSEEQKRFLDENDLKANEIEVIYKRTQASLIKAYEQRMEENKKYLDRQKYCYLRNAMAEKPSFAAAMAMCHNLETLK